MLLRLVGGVEGQWLQKEVLSAAAPVALLQLGQRPLVELDGVGVRVGPGAHGTGHAEVPLRHKRPPAALARVTHQTTSSPWARFLLQLDTRHIKRSSNYFCSVWHLAELILPQEQGTHALGITGLPQGCTSKGHWPCSARCSAKGDFSRTLGLLLMGFWVTKCVYVQFCLFTYVCIHIYTLSIYVYTK